MLTDAPTVRYTNQREWVELIKVVVRRLVDIVKNTEALSEFWH